MVPASELGLPEPVSKLLEKAVARVHDMRFQTSPEFPRQLKAMATALKEKADDD
ncbi:MAG TPA: hypothetical protein VKS79_14840 [Gemmataceae bacterium]|nr:hypothetical protein [Gemmataceae bacterium]